MHLPCENAAQGASWVLDARALVCSSMAAGCCVARGCCVAAADCCLPPGCCVVAGLLLGNGLLLGSGRSGPIIGGDCLDRLAHCRLQLLQPVSRMISLCR